MKADEPWDFSFHQPETISMYRRAVCIDRPFSEVRRKEKPKCHKSTTPGKPLTTGKIRTVKRGKIQGFSWRSKERAQFLAANSHDPLVSMAVLTYHRNAPVDGRQIKRQLNAFLTALRKTYPGIGYLWVLEFQKRGTPLIHLFLTKFPSDSLHEFIATTWNWITKESPAHLRQHLRSKSFIAWEMGDASYITKKWFGKANQHLVPDDFQNVGRFWGHNQDLKPIPTELTADDLVHFTYQDKRIVFAFLLRSLRQYQEAHVRRYGYRFKSGVMRGRAAMIIGPVDKQLNYPA